MQKRLAPDVRRRQIVTEATRLISVSGFNAVSLTDIAEACGIRGPSVLHYFPSMVDLLAAVLAFRDEVDAADPPARESLSTPEGVRAFLRSSASRNLDRLQLVRLYVVLAAEAVDPEHPAHQYFVDRERSTLVAFENLLEWKRHPSLAARELMAFWNGLEHQWILTPSTDFLAVWDNFADRFFVRD
ncbi:TetR family transcriptional regulator [Arthrobacter sp. SLBN-100]|nr:TetR family transcriptional regulator [Arthrobacter sp. SLBN-100]